MTIGTPFFPDTPTGGGPKPALVMWTELLAILEANQAEKSDPNYYVTDAGEADFRNIAKITLERTAKGSPERAQAIDYLSQLGLFLPTDNLDYWKNDANNDSGNQTALQDAAVRLGSVGTGGGLTDPDPGAPPAGATGTLPGVLQGGQLVRVSRPGEPDRYLQVYQYPPGSGQYMGWQWEGIPQIQQAVGTNFPFTVKPESFLDNVNIVGAAPEVVGMTGTFTGFINTALEEGLRQSGVSDPTILGKMLNDPEIQAIYANAFVGDWTPEQIRAEQRQTSFWTETLYPGIESLYDITANPEQAWESYANSVQGALTALGYSKDADGTYRTQIGRMLGDKIDDQTFLSMAPTFIRAQQSPAYAAQLGAWTELTLGKTIGFGEWFDLLAGEAAPDVQAVAERATLSYLASQSGTALTQEQIIRAANEQDMTDDQARSVFAEYDAALTALGTRGLGKYQLSRDDIFSLKTNLQPLSGRSLEDIRVKSLQAMREEGLLDDQKINLFVGYSTERGTPNRPGLMPLAPERG